VVNANLLAASTPKKLTGEVINIACGDRTSLNQLWEKVCVATGFSGAPRYEPTRAGDVRDSLADIHAAAELIGYEPRVRLDQGLEKTVAALRLTL